LISPSLFAISHADLGVVTWDMLITFLTYLYSGHSFQKLSFEADGVIGIVWKALLAANFATYKSL